jgi:hypothetical protein
LEGLRIDGRIILEDTIKIGLEGADCISAVWDTVQFSVLAKSAMTRSVPYSAEHSLTHRRPVRFYRIFLLQGTCYLKVQLTL